jgi:hypothetical protein
VSQGRVIDEHVVGLKGESRVSQGRVIDEHVVGVKGAAHSSRIIDKLRTH